MRLVVASMRAADRHIVGALVGVLGANRELLERTTKRSIDLLGIENVRMIQKSGSSGTASAVLHHRYLPYCVEILNRNAVSSRLQMSNSHRMLFPSCHAQGRLWSDDICPFQERHP